MDDQLDMLAGVPVPMVFSPPVKRVTVRAHMRTVKKGGAGLSGEERKAVAQAEHEAEAVKHRALEYLRYHLNYLWWRRRYEHDGDLVLPYVTADDANDLLDQWAECPSEIRKLPTRAFLGNVFKGGGWEKTGAWVASRRESSKYRLLPAWRAVAET